MSAAKHMKQSATQGPATQCPARRRANDSLAEVLVGIALAVWVCGRLILVHSDVGMLPAMAEAKPMAYVQALAFGCVVAGIAMRETRMDAVGFASLGLLLVTALTARTRLADPSLLAFALMLAVSKDMRFSRLAMFGLTGIVGAVLLIEALRVFPAEFAGANRAALAYLHFADNQVVPRLMLESLACLFLIVRKRQFLAPLFAGCILCAVVSAIRYDARRYALLMLLLGVCVVVYAVRQNVLDSDARRTWVRCLVAAIPPLLCCVVYDCVAFYNLDFMGMNEGAYASLAQNYGLLALLLATLLYVRTVLTLNECVAAFPTWTVFALYALALAFDANAMFVEMNLPLLLLSAGLGVGDSGGPSHAS